MNKKLTCMILMLVMMVTCCAFAEDAAPVPSITVVEIVLPADVVVNEEAPLVLNVKQVEPESVEKVIMDEIIEVVQEPEASVATYFDEETKAAITEVLNEVLTETLPEGATAELPEGFEVKLEDFQIDEFVAMTLEGYVAEYGEVEAEFAFTTEYVEEDILIVMIGIMPTEEEIAALETEAADADEAAEETAEEAAEETEATVASLIKWIPLKAEVVDGKVKVAFGEDVLTMVNERGAVMMVLRADGLGNTEATEQVAEATAE